MGKKGTVLHKYVRDSRSPTPKSEATSRVMSANRGKDTGPERSLKAALEKACLGGSESNYQGVPGRPDIAYPENRLAVFVNGCFWHHCPHCNLPLPKSNAEYWRAKFERNQARDERKRSELEELGWRVITVWECEIRDQLPYVLRKIQEELDEAER